ncbi:bacteriohemerythrin [candidate division GN15 bacterium]|nr:bacteriohemerythrin [candidate division GN15 bacterium]
MSFLIWDKRLSVGHAEMDEQHRQQMNLINRLHDAMVADEDQVTLETILNELINFTRKHFAAEEQLMLEQGFSGLPHHKAAHSRLIRRLREFQRRLQAGDSHAAADVLGHMQAWLVDHIREEDVRYSPIAAAPIDA